MSTDVASKSDLVAKFAKNTREEVRVSIDEFKGRKLINIRVWYMHPDTEAMLPGKQGMTLSVEKFDLLKTAIAQLGEKLNHEKG